ncbi:hypothetical protein [uncultured Faecalicoccus sp.]|uniref:hypothetical protein n=1 Tax=uncultured Faecalicoccus sp. TaxID=1971760 RepID=UPI0025CFE1FB|nr:hypothetical protein [uncultured Faecalicoccus sp.]
MKGKKMVLRLPVFFIMLALFFGLSSCSQNASKLQVRNNLVFQEGECINLSAETFLDSNTPKQILQNAILYSPLLDEDQYSVDSACNVASKGKSYLDCGEYTVTIVYQDEVKKVTFQVVPAK